MEGHDAAGVIGISSPVFGLRPGRCGLSRSWKLPKPESLTTLAALERLADLLEERLDHVLGLALVQPKLLKQQVGQFGLGQRLHRTVGRLHRIGGLRQIGKLKFGYSHKKLRQVLSHPRSIDAGAR